VESGEGLESGAEFVEVLRAGWEASVSAVSGMTDEEAHGAYALLPERDGGARNDAVVPVDARVFCFGNGA